VNSATDGTSRWFKLILGIDDVWLTMVESSRSKTTSVPNVNRQGVV
jgi:hypothetical protein